MARAAAAVVAEEQEKAKVAAERETEIKAIADAEAKRAADIVEAARQARERIDKLLRQSQEKKQKEEEAAAVAAAKAVEARDAQYQAGVVAEQKRERKKTDSECRSGKNRSESQG